MDKTPQSNASGGNPAAPNVLDPTLLEHLKRKILKDKEFDLGAYTPSYVQRRVHACLMRCNCSLMEYITILDRDPQEYQRFFDAFTINVTEFFRDATVWKAIMEDIFPRLLNEKIRRGDMTLRIWSAGCASGEEPYTIAIALREAIEKLKVPKPVFLKDPLASPKRTWSASDFIITIHATDIDPDSLKKASEANFGRESLKNVPAELLEKYFKPVHAPPQPGHLMPHPTFHLAPEIRQMVSFRKHHFLNDRPFNGLDVIFCRNVAIYLTPKNKEALLQIFYKALGQDGLLVTGKAETIFTRAKNLFFAVNFKEHVYGKERRDAKNQSPVDDEKRKNFWWGTPRKPGTTPGQNPGLKK